MVFISENSYFCKKTEMNFLDFRELFEKYPVFSIKEIEKHAPNFNKKNLVNWQKKKYLQKIRNGWYRIRKEIKNEHELFYIANKIYSPSYISLESALSYHALIPEQSFTVTSAAGLKTQNFKTPNYAFSYQNLKHELMFGYLLDNSDKFTFKIAEPEKACLDFLYLHSEIKTQEDLAAMRIDKETAKQIITRERLRQYTSLFKSNVMYKKSSMLENYIYA
jgi:predicted transcriptional regulator of viral defense system